MSLEKLGLSATPAQIRALHDSLDAEESIRMKEGLAEILESFIESVEGALSDARETLEALRDD